MYVFIGLVSLIDQEPRSNRLPTKLEDPLMPRYHITIQSKDRQAMLDLVLKHNIQVLDHTTHTTPSGIYSTDAIVEPAVIQKLEKAGYKVEQHEDVDLSGKIRQKEVGRGNRYKQVQPNNN